MDNVSFFQQQERLARNKWLGADEQPISVEKRQGLYGNTEKKSANQLYKKYVAWFTDKYGAEKKPLDFKGWIEWAIHKGIIQRNETPDTLNATPEENQSTPDKVIDNVVRKRKITIAVILLLVSIYGIAKIVTKGK